MQEIAITSLKEENNLFYLGINSFLLSEGYSTINFISIFYPDYLTFLKHRYQMSSFQLGQIIAILSDSAFGMEERLQPCCTRHLNFQSLLPGFLKYF